MPIQFDGPDGTEELIPAPLVDMVKNQIRDEGGRIIHSEYVFTLTGTIVNVGSSLDSPDAIGVNNMDGIILEQARIRNLFSQDGGNLVISSPDGVHLIAAYCLVDSVDFASGTWVNRCSYTIVLRSDAAEGDDAQDHLASKSETWNIADNEDGTFTISHNVSANGQLSYSVSGSNDPLEVARQWCRARSYTISTSGVLSVYPSSGVDSLNFTNLINALGSDSANFWNKSFVENAGPIANSWQLTENFIYNPNGNYKEDFSAVVSYEPGDPRRITVTANGNVVGFANKSSNYSLKISNAKTAFASSVEPNLFVRVSGYVPNGYSLNPVVTTKQVSYEELAGSVRYSCSFTAVSGALITNAADESINIHDTAPTDVFAQIQIPGRANGPVVQYMSTKTLPERTVSITATLIPSTANVSVSSLRNLYLAKPNTDAIVDALKPSSGYYYIKGNDEEWNPIKRQYSRQVSWVIQPEGVAVSGIPNTIHNPASGV